MSRQENPHNHEQQSPRRMSRRSVVAWSGTALLAGLAGCSGTDSSGNRTTTTSSPTPPPDSVFEAISFEGPNLVVSLEPDHNVSRLNLIAPDGSTFRQTDVAEGATTVRMQILFVSGGSYEAGEYELVAVKGKSSESMSLTLRPDIRVIDVVPERSEDDQQSTGRLLVTVENTGSGPTWVYNIGFRNAPYPNAPQVLKGEGVAITGFERPENSKEQFLAPNAQQVFLKERPVIVISDSDEVSCQGSTLELRVVVQTPHGDVEQPIRAHLSGGYNVEDPVAVQHPCKHVEIELKDGDGGNA